MEGLLFINNLGALYIARVFLLAQIENINCKGNTKYNQPGRASTTRVEIKNDARMRFVHPSDN